MKGLKEVISMNKDTLSHKGYITITGNLIKEMWENVCQESTLPDMLNGKKKVILSLFAECLWMIRYTPVTPKVNAVYFLQAEGAHVVVTMG